MRRNLLSLASLRCPASLVWLGDSTNGFAHGYGWCLALAVLPANWSGTFNRAPVARLAT